jgi:anti-anti-sigma regulatory factor
MRMSQRQVVTGVFALLIVSSLAFIAQALLRGEPGGSISSVIGLVVFGGLLAAYRAGWSLAPYAFTIILTLMVGFALPEPYLTEQASVAVVIVPVVALILTSPAWVLGTTLALLAMLIGRSGAESVYLQPVSLISIAMVVGGIILSRLVTDTAQRDAEASAARAEAALAEAQASAAALARQAAELTRQNEEQARLIDLVATLETPSVALADGVILAPVVGHLDSRRAASLTERLLRDVSGSRARLVVLDVAGVAAIDTGVAQALLRAVQAVRLLGCDVTITGISASVAATMTELGISMAGVQTARTPQEALSLAAAVPAGAHSARRN